MANTIRIKRRAAGVGAGAPSGLANAELAYNEGDNILYYGFGAGGAGGTATQVIAIAGSGAYLNKNNNLSDLNNRQTSRNNLADGTVTSGLFMRGNGTNVLMGSIIASDVPTLNQNTTGSAGSVTSSLTINNGGAGDSSGSTFNGSSAKTISYNSIGSPSVGGANATGTWNISVTGNAGTVTSGVYTSRTITPGSGLAGSAALDLSADRTFNIGQGDGISVSADSIAVDSTVVRTTGNQTISGVKTFKQSINAVSGINVNNGDENLNFKYGDIFTVGFNDTGYLLRCNNTNNTNRGQVDINAKLVMNVPGGGLVNSFIIDPYGYTFPGDSQVSPAVTSGYWRASTIDVDKGGTGRTSYSNGQLLIGSGTSLAASTLTQGSGISITNGSGTITINNSRIGSTSIVLSGSEYQRAAITGDVTASQNNNVTTIANDAVTNAKAANMAVNTIKGRITAGTGDPEDLTAANVRTIINVEDGANNYAHPTQSAITESNANGKVLSAVSVNTLGHVTSIGTKTLAEIDIPALSTDKLTSGTLGVGRGGTGAATLTQNNILIGNGTNAISAPYTVETTLTGGTSAIPRADAVKTYVDSAITSGFSTNDAMVFKGTIGAGGTPGTLPTGTISAGWTYRVVATGTYAGVVSEVGDLIIGVADAAGNVNSTWTVVQTNLDGAVIGPASSTTNALAVFDGITGKLIKNSSFVPTTVGSGLINLTNPGAIRFVRINADNSVAALSDSDFRTAIGAYASSNPNGYTTNVGTVTSVAALTMGTTGTDVSSTVATNTTTPVITLNIPTASSSVRGVLSSGDWTTFNNKVSTSRSITVAGTANQITSSAGAQDLSANRTWTLSLPQDIHSAATPTFGGLTANGTVNIRSASTASTATQIPVFIADPSSTTRAIVTRTPAQLLSDIGAYAASNPNGYTTNVGTVTTISAGNGMNYSPITTTGNIVLGTPSSITLSSTNSVTATSHTHAFAPGGTTSQYIRGDGAATSGAALTKTDDTNVTLTIGGSPTNALLSATSLTLGWTGNLAVNRGGTAQTSYTDGQLLIGNSTGNTLTKATLTQGSNVTITNGNGSITIASTNTATAAGNILFGSNSGTQITYAPYSDNQAASASPRFYNTTDNPSGSGRLNVSAYFYATRLFDNGSRVVTADTICSDAGNCTWDGGTF